MKRHRLMRVCAIGALTLSTAAVARPLSVTGANTWTFNGSTGVLSISDIPPNAGGFGSVSVTTSVSNPPYVNIDITRIDVDTTGAGSRVEISVNSGASGGDTIRHIGGIRRSGGSPNLNIVGVYNAGDLGSINGGTMTGTVEAYQIDSIEPGGSIYGAVNAGAGGLRNISLANGNLRGNVTSQLDIGGPFSGITVDNGNIGVPGGGAGGRVTISAANGGIGGISAKAVNATISAPTGVLGAVGPITVTQGDFEGSVTANTLPRLGGPGLDIQSGNLSGDITLSGAITGFAGNPDIRVAKSFSANHTITLPQNGLQGQIIVNAKNSTGQWLGAVKLGSGSNLITLAPGYSTLPSAIGNGASGLAPFTQHGPASVPAKNGQIYSSGIDRNSQYEPPPCIVIPNRTAVVEFYGGVTVDVGTAPSAVAAIRSWPIGQPSVITNYTVDSYLLDNNRRITLKLPQSQYFLPGHIVEVTIYGGVVKCTGLPFGVAATVAQFSYTFTSVDGCQQLFDRDTNGLVNWNDLPAYLNAPADLDENGVIADRDLSILIRGISEHGQ